MTPGRTETDQQAARLNERQPAAAGWLSRDTRAARKPAPAGQRTTLAQERGRQQAPPRSDATAVAAPAQQQPRRTQGRNAVSADCQPLRHDAGRAETAQQAARQPGQRRHPTGSRSAGASQQATGRQVTQRDGRARKPARQGRHRAAARSWPGRRQGGEKAANKARTRQADPAAARKQTKLAQYTIRRGDTLVSIAKQFRVEKDDLLRWNRIQSNDIKPGQRLTIQLVQNTSDWSVSRPP
jgi:LysM repeat protein